MVHPNHERALFLEEMSRADCLDRLKSVHIGRVGITVGALPVILPVNFALIDEEIYFRTGVGTKLAAATSEAVAAFQADAYAPDGSAGWSVLVVGNCARVTDPESIDRALEILTATWSPVEDADYVVRIPGVRVTGRQFGDVANPWLLLH